MSSGPAAQDENRYAAGVLANIIGDDTGSRLYWALIETALADAADLEFDPMDGTGLFYAYISCDPEKADKVMEVVKMALTEVRLDGVTEQELVASKNKIASSATLNGELPMGRLVPLGANWVYRNEYRSLAEEIAAIEAVGSEDVRQILEEYPLEKFSVLRLGPEPKTAAPENL